MAGSARRNARSRVKSSVTSGAAGDEDELSDCYLKPSVREHKDRSRSKGNQSSIRVKAAFGFSIFVFLGSSYIIYCNLLKRMDTKTRVVTPFPAPKLTDLPQFQGDHKESLYWGTYRPHIYLGIRARTPESLIFGLMWVVVKDGQLFIRHMCQDSDGLSTYGWTQHNGRDYGHQLLVDHDLTLETSFLKSKTEDSSYGGDWVVRVDVQSKRIIPVEGVLDSEHLFFYVGDENGHAISLNEDAMDIHEDSLLASGSRMDVGDWQLHLQSEDDLKVHYSGFKTPHFHNLSYLVQANLADMDDLKVHYSGFKTPHFHNLSYLVQANLADMLNKFGRLELTNTYDHSPNVLVFQVSAKGSFIADVAYVSGTNLEISRVKERVNSLTGGSLNNQLIEKQNEFDNRFEHCFNLSDKLDSKSKLVGKAALSNMLGSIGYFYGQSKISLPKKSDIDGDDYVLYWPAELYTAVPSRSFFPRGFLWDEGFHQVLIRHWDINICLDIIGHWLDLMNIDGWIPREQILGAEALSKVPAEFVLQHPTNGNPPTLFLVLHDIVYQLKKNKFTATESSVISSFLERAFVRLDAWFKWFNTTQSGKDVASYFWHGRDGRTTRELNPKTLSSGLDDYPRASHPSEDERHLDLRCWMLLAADSMCAISEHLKNNDELGKGYGFTSKLLSDFDILNQMHFDEAHGAYFDFGNHTEKVRLSWQMMKNGNYANRELVREVLEMPKLRLVPHIGYVSLFPFMGRIIPPDSWILEKQLDLISNKSTLWTNYGVRSLSKTSSLYMKRNTEHDPPYWRGPIWMNMNYMILSALHHYTKAEGPYKARAKSIYDDLRENLIRNIVNNYHKTGYLWEQYDQKTGKGRGQRPFTGWTSLVLLIMAEAYSDSWGVPNFD